MNNKVLDSFCNEDWKISARGNPYKIFDKRVYVITNHVNHNIDNKEHLYHVDVGETLQNGTVYTPFIEKAFSVEDAKKRIFNKIFFNKEDIHGKKIFDI
jgi:hypothetical protein